MEENKIFRKKTIDNISSPEQLSDYLRVTNPGIWIILSAIVIMLTGFIVWSAVGTLETTADANAIVSNGIAKIAVMETGQTEISTGMTVRIASENYIISEVAEDEYGRDIAYVEVSLPDGIYQAGIVTEQIHPIEFLLESR